MSFLKHKQWPGPSSQSQMCSSADCDLAPWGESQQGTNPSQTHWNPVMSWRVRMELQQRWFCSSEKFHYIFYFLVIRYVKSNQFLFLIIIVIIGIAELLLCLTVLRIHALIEYIYNMGTKMHTCTKIGSSYLNRTHPIVFQTQQKMTNPQLNKAYIFSVFGLNLSIVSLQDRIAGIMHLCVITWHLNASYLLFYLVLMMDSIQNVYI